MAASLENQLELMARETIAQVLPVTRRLRPPAPVCAICLWPRTDSDIDAAVAWTSYLTVILAERRDRAIEGLVEWDRWGQAWNGELSYTSMLSVEFEDPTPTFRTAFSAASEVLEPREEEEGSYFLAYQYIFDEIARRITELAPVANATRDFVAHPDYYGDFDTWLPISLRNIATPNVLGLLEQNDLVPPTPQEEGAPEH